VTDGRTSRVLIVDDSVMTRRLLTRALKEEPDIQVVAEAGDALSARALLAQHRPDVITLDLEMPRVDGLAFLRHLMAHTPTPVIVVSSFTPSGSAASIEALRAGAVDVIPKPESPRLVAPFARRLKRRVREIRQHSLRLANAGRIDRARPAAPLVSPAARSAHAIIAVGASTGGPQALEALLSGLPADMPPIAIVQHMPAGFTAVLAKRLHETSRLQVVEATDRQPVRRGVVLVAPGDYHLTVAQHDGQLWTVLRRSARVHHQRPSVDVLFQSLSRLKAVPVVGILLTGMGEDGADGMTALAQAGHQTIAQDEQSCVVFGMPREAIARGGAGRVVPLDRVAATLCECLDRLPVKRGGSRDAPAPPPTGSRSMPL
jgi:two-component system chemotaxis response regulator CheB